MGAGQLGVRDGNAAQQALGVAKAGYATWCCSVLAPLPGLLRPAGAKERQTYIIFFSRGIHMKKKVISAALAGTLAVSLLSACGASNEPQNISDVSSAASSEATSTTGLRQAAGTRNGETKRKRLNTGGRPQNGRVRLPSWPGTMANVTVISGNYTLPPCTFTAPEGKQFKGWATSADGEVITGTSITVSADTKLFAIWEPKAPVVVSDDPIGNAVLKGTYHKPPRRIHFRIKAEKNEETV